MHIHKMLTFKQLRKDNIFKRKNRPDLFEEFKSNREKWKDIAEELGVTEQALYNFWRRHFSEIARIRKLEQETSIKIAEKVKKHHQDIAKVGKDLMVPINEHTSFQGKTAVHTLAKTHTDILRISVSKLKRICDDDNLTREYVLLANSIRGYISDWLNLFGTLPDNVASTAIDSLKIKVERTVDFLIKRSPQLVAEYMEYINGETNA